MKLNSKTLLYSLVGLYVVGSFVCPDVFARTDGDFATETARTEEFIFAIARILLIALCLMAAGISIAKQQIMGVIFGVGGAFFFYMMKAWINTAFPMII